MSAISIMVSVAALCRTYPHTSELGNGLPRDNSRSISVAYNGAYRVADIYHYKYKGGIKRYKRLKKGNKQARKGYIHTFNKQSV